MGIEAGGWSGELRVIALQVRLYTRRPHLSTLNTIFLLCQVYLRKLRKLLLLQIRGVFHSGNMCQFVAFRGCFHEENYKNERLIA